MQTIIKPRSLGILTKPERRRGSVSFIVTAMGLFDLSTPDDFMSEQAIWPMVAKELPQGQMLDMGMPKPCGEVLVAGRAMAPGGEPIRAMTASVEIGSVAKFLGVFGNRVWRQTSSGPLFSEPEPFVEMPIEPGRSFGGPGHPTNPGGLGFGAERLLEGGQPVPMPNVEDARRLIRGVRDAPPPVRVGPIDPTSPERRQFAGTYDQTWLDKDAPGLPQDVDPRLFLVAPQDQRVEGYFQGDEPYRVAGFSAKNPEVSGRLPGFGVRAFIQRSSEPAGLYEVPMRLDTVWFFASQNKGVLLYHGATTTSDVEGRDVTAILLAYERLDAEPRPVSHYAEQIALRTAADPKEAIKHSFADDKLRPVVDGADRERRLRDRIAHNAAIGRRHDEGMRYFLAQQAAKLGIPAALLPHVPDSEPLPFLVPSPEDLERGEIDLAALIDGVDKFANDTLGELSAKAEEMKAQFAGIEAGGAPKLADLDALLARLAPGAMPEGGLKASLEQTRAGIAVPDGGDHASAEAARAGIARIDAMLSGALTPPTQDEETQFSEARARYLGLPEGSLLHPAVKAMEDARRQVRDSAAGLPDAESPPAALPTIDQILASLALPEGAPDKAARALADAGPLLADVDAKLAKAMPGLAADTGIRPLDALLASLPKPEPETGPRAETFERKLAEADASLREGVAEAEQGLRAIRLKSPVATHPIEPLAANVARRLGAFALSRLQEGHGLAGVDLAGVDLSGADLGGLDLRGTMFENALLAGARLAGANCAGTVFAGADLSGADLGRCDLTGANLGGATLLGTRFSGATLKGAMMLGSRPAGADFSGATLEDIQLMQVDLSNIVLDGATLRNIMALSCPMTGLSARQASLETCQFLAADAAGADFAQARLTRCAFLRIDLPGSRFVEAVFDTVVFLGGCDMTGADFARARGRSAGFTAAKLQGARFDAARLDDCSFMEADLGHASFRLASLRTAMLNSANLTAADFFGANLLKSQMRRADFTGASVRGANLYSCDLTDTVLHGADLSRANLGKTRLEAASDVV